MITRSRYTLVKSLALMFAVAALLIGGCGDDSEPPPVTPSVNLIVSDSGGIATLNGQVTVTIPPEAISVDAEVQIKLIDPPPALPGGYGFASPTYEIGLSAGEVTDTISVTVTYLDSYVPEGLLEGGLLIGRFDGQSWVFENPAIEPSDNRASAGTMTLGKWAVIWKAQGPKEVISSLFSGLIDDVTQKHRADFDLALGAADVAEVVTLLGEFKSSFDAASAEDPVVQAAITDFLEVNQAIEDYGNLVDLPTAIELTRSYLELGLATGYDAGDLSADPPLVEMGARRFMPAAFAALFRYSPGYTCVWASGKAGHLQSTESVQHDFFVQLNYNPTFGGLTFLDPPPGVERQTRILGHEVTGTYRMDLVHSTTAASKTVYYDYLRDRELVLHWPIESEIIMFNLVGTDEAVRAIAYAIEFEDLLIDFQVANENPFAQDVQGGELGSWIYFGLPHSLMIDLRKQDGRMVFAYESGGTIEHESFVFPVNRRPLLVYGDWTAPAAVADLEAIEYRGNLVRLRWTAPGNDIDSGTATVYDLRQSTSPIDMTNWEQALCIEGEPVPAEAGTVQEILLLPYDLSATQYLAIRTRDADFNFSPLSNVIQLLNLSELVVDIPDRNLEQVIRAEIAKPSGTVYASDVTGITEFSAIGRNVIVLEGMQFVSNLTALDFSSNLLIEDISPLSRLIDLQQLRLSVNNIHDISPLSELYELRVLELTSNYIYDLSPLVELVKLNSLNLRHNQVSVLGALTGLNLKFLDLGDNEVTDVSALQYLDQIDILILDKNNIAELTPLVDNPGLAAGDLVDLRGNPLSRVIVATQVKALQDRGVEVLFDEPQ